MQRALVLLLCGVFPSLTLACDRSRCCCPPENSAVVTMTMEKQNSKNGDIYRLAYGGFGSGCEREGDLHSIPCRMRPATGMCKEIKGGQSKLQKTGNKMTVYDGVCSFVLKCSRGLCKGDNSEWKGTYKKLPGPTYPPTTVPPGCVEVVNGKNVYYPEGSDWNPSPCVYCSCLSGQPSCYAVTCGPVSNLCMNVGTDGCCDECLDAHLGCDISADEDQVQLVSHSTQWVDRSTGCRHCTCDNGEARCADVQCEPVPGCIEYEVDDTTCCPGCKRLDPMFIKCHGLSSPAMDRDGNEVTCRLSDAPCPDKSECHTHPLDEFAVCCPSSRRPEPNQQCSYQFPDGKKAKFNSSDEFIVKLGGLKCRECICYDGLVTCNKTECKLIAGCQQYEESKTQCCPPCKIFSEEGMCRYRFPNGTRTLFKSGDQWPKRRDGKHCKQCRCADGEVRCDAIACDPIYGCSKYEENPAHCCPRCAMWDLDEFPCRNESSPLTDDAGNTVNCGRGQGGCPLDSYCHIHKTDRFAVCCPAVTPTPATDACESVSCRRYQECLLHEGTPYCADTCNNNGGCSDDEVCVLVAQACDELPCPKIKECNPMGPVLGGDCIVSFSGGRVGMYKHKEKWMPNKCTMCTCQNGAVNCHDLDCNVPGCGKYSQPPRGQCCGTCVMYDPAAVNRIYPGACIVKTSNSESPEIIYKDDNKWLPDPSDPCISCQCQNGTSTCVASLCARDPDCLIYADVDDVCCPECEIHKQEACEVNTSLGYILIRKSYQKDPCTSCKCRKGERGEVAALQCKEQNCRRLNKGCAAVAEPKEGQCCGECISMSPSPTSSKQFNPSQCSVELSNGTVVEVSEGDFRLGQCDACTCDRDGMYSCQFEPIVACPEDPDCEEYKERELGSCCRMCAKSRQHEPRGEECTTEDAIYEDGSTWHPNNDTCRSCYCNNSMVSCIRLECPQLSGCQDYGDIPDGECCPVCISGRVIVEDVCTLPKESGQCLWRFNRWYFDDGSYQCQPFAYSGCAGNGNNFASEAKCEATCKEKPEETCYQPVDVGVGKQELRQYFFNVTSLTCERFTYRGLGGNGNRYDTRSDCLRTCKTPGRSGSREQICVQPMDEGPCRGRLPRFYYNAKKGICRPFNYGGCQGNSNHFKSKKRCESYCSGVTAPTSPVPTQEPVTTAAAPTTPASPGRLCTLPKAIGPCRGSFPHYYFNFDSKRCERFNYGGCGGNQNRFTTLAECQSTCPVNLYPMEACMLPVRRGPCKAIYPRYFYNSTSSECEMFTYGGCLGNTNNFLDMPSCMRHCAGGPTSCIKRQMGDIDNCTNTGCFITQCSVVGDFISKQCYDMTGDCWCVNKDGVTEDNSQVPLVRADLLNCGSISLLTTKCRKRQQRQLRKCGMNLGCLVYSCQADGSFAYKQCYTSGRCFCVDKNGQERAGQQVNGDLVCERPTESPTQGPSIIKVATKKVIPTFAPSTAAVTTPMMGTIEPTTPHTRIPTKYPPGHPCHRVTCSFGATCQSGHCTCNRACSRKKTTVCGTDGQTYRNPCNLGRIACLQMRVVAVRYEGRCGSRPELTDEPLADTETPTFTDQPTIPANRCTLPPEKGVCRAYLQRFFFNSTSNQCESFVYGGCQGNANNFEDFFECQEYCGGPEGCLVNPERVIYEDQSDTVYGVTDSSHLAPTCHHDIVLFVDKVMSSPDPTVVARQISKLLDTKLSEVTSKCPNPEVRFGLVRLSFSTNSYAHIPLGKDKMCMGTYKDFRQALKTISTFTDDKMLSAGTDPVLPSLVDTLDSCDLCMTDHCGCYRHFVLIADHNVNSAFPFGDVVHQTLANGHVFLHSIVDTGLTNVDIGYTEDKQYKAAGGSFVAIDQRPVWPTNRLAQVALQTHGSAWEFDKCGDKPLQLALVDVISTSPMRMSSGCHMCECQGSELQCCYLYGRTEGTCKLGCEFKKEYTVISDNPPLARAIDVSPEDNSVCEIVVVAEETEPAKSAVDWIRSEGFCTLAKKLRENTACSGGIKFGLYGFGDKGKEGRCGHAIEFGMGGRRMWGSCMEIQAAASSKLKTDISAVKGDVYCALDSIIDVYQWMRDSYKAIILVSSSARRVRDNSITIESLRTGLESLGATMAAVVGVSFSAVQFGRGSPFGLANAGLRDAYLVDSINSSDYIGSSRGFARVMSGQAGSDLAQLAYDVTSGRQYGSAWNINELVLMSSRDQGHVFNKAFADSLTHSLHTAAAVCVECQCQDATVKCKPVEGQRLIDCLPVV